MKEAAEKWIPCTSAYPDYEICISRIISIRRVKAAQGSYRGKRISIQYYKKHFWATLYNRHGEAKRVNILQMAEWAASAEWKRSGCPKGEKPVTGKRAAATVAPSVALPSPPAVAPKPTRETIKKWIAEVYRAEYAPSVENREIARLQAMLAELESSMPL